MDELRDRIDTIIGIIHLLKSNQIGDTTEVIGLDKYNELSNYTESLLVVLCLEYGIERTNKIIEKANQFMNENYVE